MNIGHRHTSIGSELTCLEGTRTLARMGLESRSSEEQRRCLEAIEDIATGREKPKYALAKVQEWVADPDGKRAAATLRGMGR